MKEIMTITDVLCQALQQKSLDILNVIRTSLFNYKGVDSKFEK
jgi:hypothetical protein